MLRYRRKKTREKLRCESVTRKKAEFYLWFNALENFIMKLWKIENIYMKVGWDVLGSLQREGWRKGNEQG